MTRLEADRRAKELWGKPRLVASEFQGPIGFAIRHSDDSRHRRFVVGVVMSGPIPLGWGDSFEAAFTAAEANGFNREMIDQAFDKSLDAHISELERIARERGIPEAYLQKLRDEARLEVAADEGLIRPEVISEVLNVRDATEKALLEQGEAYEAEVTGQDGVKQKVLIVSDDAAAGLQVKEALERAEASKRDDGELARVIREAAES